MLPHAALKDSYSLCYKSVQEQMGREISGLSWKTSWRSDVSHVSRAAEKEDASLVVKALPGNVLLYYEMDLTMWIRLYHNSKYPRNLENHLP